MLATYGITSVHDAGIGSSTVAAYKELVREAPLPVRVYAMIAASDPLYQDRLAEGFFHSEDMTLAVESVKVVADGALGSRGAALIEDYHDSPGYRGLLRYNDERLEYLIRSAMNADFQVATHAIGDNANMRVLDNYERLIRETDSKDRRHRVEHAQILRYEDIMRFAELGVIPSMQATHATSDKNMAEDRLGPVRIQGLMPGENFWTPEPALPMVPIFRLSIEPLLWPACLRHTPGSAKQPTGWLVF